MRRYKLKVAVLRILESADDSGFLMREDDLHNELTLSVRPAPVSSETRAVVAELDSERRVLGVRDGDVLRLQITPAGRAWYQIQVSG